VVGATLFAHWPALSARALTFDDGQYLTENLLVQRPSWASAGRFLREVLKPSTVGGYYQPLAMISLMLDYAAAGRPDNLRPFHRTSLILHAANTVLVIVLLYMLFGQPLVAAMVGLLFGVHPMTVETIPWIGERKTLLAAFFALWCLIAYVRYARRPGWKLYATCLVLYVLALMSKPISTPLPVVMLLMDFWPLHRLNKRTVLEKIPLLAISVIFGAITVISQGRSAGLEMPTQYPASRIPLILCHNIVFYLYKIVWPSHLTSHYPFPRPLDLSDPMILAGVIGTCILIPALLISLRWTRALLTGWLIFFVAIFPTMGVLGFTIVIASDKYAYLPSVGLLIILAWLLERIWSGGTATGRVVRQAGTVAVVVVAAGLLANGTRHYLAYWQTTAALYDHMLELAPNAYQLYNDRANAYNDGDYDRVIRACNRAIELKPDYAFAYNNRGNAYKDLREFERAIQDYDKAISLKPDYADAYYDRANAYNDMGDFGQAIRDYTRAIELKPDFAKAYSNRGISYGNMRDLDQAIRDYTRAVDLKPDYVEAYSNRGNAYRSKGDFGQAIRDYTKAIELKPDFAKAYSNRGNAYNDMHDYDQAIRDYTTAIELKPDFAEAHNNRGNAYNDIRDFDRAILDYGKAIELRPDYAEAYYNRANTFSDMGDLGRAIRDYTKAIELKSDYADAYSNRAIAHFYLKEYEKAWADVRMARRLGATPPPDLINALTGATGRSE